MSDASVIKVGVEIRGNNLVNTVHTFSFLNYPVHIGNVSKQRTPHTPCFMLCFFWNGRH